MFDFGFDQLPAGHHYVGPLGIWEAPTDPPAYLGEPGEPWVLVSISSQLQDDVPLAEAALRALADKPVRVVVTVGTDHQRDEIPEAPGPPRSKNSSITVAAPTSRYAWELRNSDSRYDAALARSSAPARAAPAR